jgi:Holliday junction resolvase-like predicted endonuclease
VNFTRGMGLKSIKATLHPSIVARFKSLDLVLNIVVPSAECANSGRPETAATRGLLSEFYAARAATDKRGWALRYHRMQSPFGEIDLVFLDRRGVVRAVEVKSIGPNGWIQFRVGLKQRQKLSAARLWLEHRSRRPTTLDLAVVSHAGEIQWFPDFLS